MPELVRSYSRQLHEMRPVSIERGVAPYAEGSCLISFGETRVLCTATVEEGVPGWRKGSKMGWLTAEYAMLPRATRGQVGGRTQEIQRLIGRSVRAMLSGFDFGERTIKVDCDVLLAGGGTRTAAITGACVAVSDAFTWLMAQGALTVSPVVHRVAAVSVGVVDGVPVLDLDYPEDVRAGVDMNVVMVDAARFVEVQGTGEHATFDRAELDALLELASAGIAALDASQVRALGTLIG